MALTKLLFSSCLTSAAAHVRQIPLTQHRGTPNATQATLPSAHRYSSHGHNGHAILPETLDAGFWYDSFDVGASHNLSLLIDTATQDILIDPDQYCPSLCGVNLRRNGSEVYQTTQENGCGNANISYAIWNDTVNVAGLVARNHTFGSMHCGVLWQRHKRHYHWSCAVLFGYYPCHSPPSIGFQLTTDGLFFDIEPSAFQQADNGNNNCTAIVTGIDIEPGLWIIGQAWFQGKYIDFQQENEKIAVGRLRQAVV